VLVADCSVPNTLSFASNPDCSVFDTYRSAPNVNCSMFDTWLFIPLAELYALVAKYILTALYMPE